MIIDVTNLKTSKDETKKIDFTNATIAENKQYQDLLIISNCRNIEHPNYETTIHISKTINPMSLMTIISSEPERPDDSEFYYVPYIPKNEIYIIDKENKEKIMNEIS